MFLRMLFIAQFISLSLCGQKLPNSIELNHGTIKLYSLSQHQTLVRPQVLKTLISYLDSLKLPIENYFVEAKGTYSFNTLYLSVWDKVGIATIQKGERLSDSLNAFESNGDKKIKYPKPVGNPGNCFTIVYDLDGDKLIGIDYWD